MRAAILLGFLLSACAGQARGETDQTSSLVSAELDAIFEDWDSDSSPGCSVAASVAGAVVLSAAYGMANLDHAVGNSRQTVFHVASVSKQFTAAAILLLVEEGKLSLDDHPGKYISEIGGLDDALTIRQLIHHSSGIRDQWDLLSLSGWRYSEDRISTGDVLQLLSRQRDLNFPPNSEYLYSNSGYTLLAEIVARVSGQSFRQFTTDRIFEPMAMNNTFFRDNFDEVVRNQAYGYARASTGEFELSVTNFDTVGATSLLTTPEDLLKWGRQFSASGQAQPGQDDARDRVLDDVLIEQMIESGVLNDGSPSGYGFGLSIAETRGQRSIGHGGADAGYRAFVLNLPDAGISVAIACNTPANVGALALQVVEIAAPGVLAAEVESETPEESVSAAVELSAEQLSAMNGRFYNSRRRLLSAIETVDGALVLHVQGNTLPIVTLSERRIAVQGIGSAEFNADFSVLDLTQGEEGSSHHRLMTVADSSVLENYVGTYLAAELDVPYRIQLASDESELRLSFLKNPDQPLTYIDAENLVAPRVSLQFQFDESGRAKGFLLSSGRIRDLQFDKVTDW